MTGLAVQSAPIFPNRDASEISSTTDYIADTYGLGINYGIPLTEYATFRAGINFENTEITDTDGTSTEIKDYLLANGNSFDVLTLNLNLTNDTRNRTVFAEKGSLQRLSFSLAVPGSELEYYKLGYRLEYYYSLSEISVLSFTNRIDYGTGYGNQEELPFFERYFCRWCKNTERL